MKEKNIRGVSQDVQSAKRDKGQGETDKIAILICEILRKKVSRADNQSE